MGTSHRDVIMGRGGDDVIRGLGGDDLVCGGPGDDRLVGGSGDDELRAETGDDVVVGGAGDDALYGGRYPWYGDSLDVLRGGGGNDLLSDVDEVSGEDERWPVFPESDLLAGGPGDDRLISAWGPDRVRAGDGNDFVDIAVGACGRVTGDAGSDRVNIDVGQRGAASFDARTGTLSGGPDGAPCSTVLGFESYEPAAFATFDFRGSDAPERLVPGTGWRFNIAGASEGYQRLRAEMGGGDDVVAGSSGPDVVDAGAGHDTVDGGSGADDCRQAESTFDCEADAWPLAPAVCDGLPATIVAGPAGGLLVGTPDDDVIVGFEANDRIDALGGNDVVCGGAGSDVLAGGEGADRLYGGPDAVLRSGGRDDGDVLGAVGDAVLPGAGADRVDPGDDPLQDQVNPPIAGLVDVLPDVVDYTDSPLGIAVDLTPVSGVVQVHVAEETDAVLFPVGTMLRGSPHADRITGSADDDRVAGTGGGDTIVAGAGNDRVDGDGSCGWYDVACAPGVSPPAILDGGTGGDWLTTHAFTSSTVHGGDGDDFVEVVMDSPGRPYLDGGAGRDTLGLDYLRPSRTTSDTVDLGAGTIAWDGRAGGPGHVAVFEELRLDRDAVWTVYGTSGPDSIWGASRVFSRGGDDFVSATFGPDLVDMGPGHDEVWAYDGKDTCLHAEVTSSCEIKKAG
jgi:Ca2+-binding RTX toxin-like protein